MSKYGYEISHSSKASEGKDIKRSNEFVIWIVVFACVILTLLGIYLLPKVANGKYANGFVGSQDEAITTTDSSGEWKNIELIDENLEGEILISLNDSISIDSISIENDYRDRVILVRLDKSNAKALESTKVSGDSAVIDAVAYRITDREALISIQMKNIYEYEVTQNENNLSIKYMDNHDVYDNVVVISPIYTEVDGIDITYDIARLVSELASENNIKIYIARAQNSDRLDAEKYALIVDSGADIVLELDISSENDSTLYGLDAVYNDKYYNPECENAKVADALLRAIASKIRNRANSLEQVDDNTLLDIIDVPAAGINVGYISNDKERELLLSGEYRKLIAEGIVEGILSLTQS